MQLFTEEVINIIKSIPKGQVRSYGEIAAMAGNPRGARQVSRILHTMTKKYDLPWHRVVNSQLSISIKDEVGAMRQQELLEAEGIVFKGKQIVLD